MIAKILLDYFGDLLHENSPSWRRLARGRVKGRRTRWCPAICRTGSVFGWPRNRLTIKKKKKKITLWQGEKKHTTCL